MNICFLSGKIISKIEFEFIINNKDLKSIAIFYLELTNKNIIKVKAYNKLADYCYNKLNTNDVIYIEGMLSNSQIECFKLYNKEKIKL